MTTYQVNDMSCNHCMGAITTAVKAIDPSARIQFDLGSKTVRIDSIDATPLEVSDAISDAGYTPVLMVAQVTRPTPSGKSGCCCRRA